MSLTFPPTHQALMSWQSGRLVTHWSKQSKGCKGWREPQRWWMNRGKEGTGFSVLSSHFGTILNSKDTQVHSDIYDKINMCHIHKCLKLELYAHPFQTNHINVCLKYFWVKVPIEKCVWLSNSRRKTGACPLGDKMCVCACNSGPFFKV